MYDKDALRHGIEQAHKHIKTFEDAIEKERSTIAQYELWIEEIEMKEAQANNGSKD